MPDNPAFDRETWEERAAIREFDGGYSRKEAERLAMDDLGYPSANQAVGPLTTLFLPAKVANYPINGKLGN